VVLCPLVLAAVVPELSSQARPSNVVPEIPVAPMILLLMIRKPNPTGISVLGEMCVLLVLRPET